MKGRNGNVCDDEEEEMSKLCWVEGHHASRDNVP